MEYLQKLIIKENLSKITKVKIAYSTFFKHNTQYNKI